MGKGLRIVTFNVFPPAYRLVAEWAARHGHQLVLLVTVPGNHDDRYGDAYPDLVTLVPSTQDVLVTTRLRRTGAPVIAALEPDLIVVATFPRRIPPEVTAIPRFGALNVHPTALPRGRGPNPQRAVYEGEPTVAVTLHRMDPEFDAGPILSQREVPRPADLTAPSLLQLWMDLSAVVLEEGVARAVAGETGEPQDHRLATYSPPFTEAERWLDWTEPALTLQRRAAALNVAAPTAMAEVDGRPAVVLDVRALRFPAPPVAPGTILRYSDDVVTVRVADGTVSVRLQGQRRLTGDLSGPTPSEPPRPAPAAGSAAK
ncbi:MAG TPA: formyltransferase family protein [Candidatus Dormibacteraeota bacterium]|nr:formyltransferase family protein [Candidatus Dormibacteraeota bacterium]